MNRGVFPAIRRSKGFEITRPPLGSQRGETEISRCSGYSGCFPSRFCGSRKGQGASREAQDPPGAAQARPRDGVKVAEGHEGPEGGREQRARPVEVLQVNRGLSGASHLSDAIRVVSGASTDGGQYQ